MKKWKVEQDQQGWCRIVDEDGFVIVDMAFDPVTPALIVKRHNEEIEEKIEYRKKVVAWQAGEIEYF